MAGFGGIQGPLPVFDGKQFDDWRIKMQAIFGFQDVSEVIEDGFPELSDRATEEEKKNYKWQVKLDSKISKAATAKEVWDILVKTYGDGDRNTKVKLQALRRHFEILVMDESETVAEYFDKVQELVNKMRVCKDGISDEYIGDKILRTLSSRFDNVVVAIEETRRKETMEIEELLNSLEAHEFRINERRQCQEQALQKLGHYAKDCWSGEGAKNKPKKRATLAQEEQSDSEPVMLMAKTEEDSSENDVWYLDSRCSTHMTGRKDWFMGIQGVAQEKIRFADNRSLVAEGTGRVVLRDAGGKELTIEEVLYVPGLKSNLLSLGQLLQKGYVMKMENNSLSIFDQQKRMVVQAHLSHNRTFRVVMSVVKHQCFTTSEIKEEWLWHLRFGHLNFKDLSLLGQGKMVNGLSNVEIPDTICRKCVQCKQTRGSFQKNLPQRSVEKLGVVYYDVCGPM
ncbi:uncharacterized protein LOC124846575 [Vigna umbellata]|uniref:uncharacterized protein LOC124846575 n=1 Tax=Vigna umbellata TaxID=87088 RepID=UPI001F5E5E62|nr:uncharacterized protein LOC124846575 [Vigna umbellata]